MTSRESPIVLMLRMFVFFFVGALMVSLFFNGLSGRDMFPFRAVIGVAVVLTLLTTGIGWTVVTGGSELLLRDDPEFQKWKAQSGRAYWDYLGWPINTATPVERQTGVAEPRYTDFVPPGHFKYQCPQCGARVEHAIDVCSNCNYGADGNTTI